VSRSARLHRWEGIDVATLRERWRLPALVILSETTSTNDIARRMAAQGAPAGLLVMAEHQTAGRGRMRRHWSDSPGHSLLLSFVLRPNVVEGVGKREGEAEGTGGSAASAPGAAPLRVGMALVEALNGLVGVGLQVKWPNDVVCDDGKIAGILCEASSAGRDTVIVAGIGINVSQRDDDWDGELRGRAASLASIAAASPSAPALPGRLAVMDAIVAAIRPLFTRPLSPLDTDERRRFGSLDALLGRDVTLDGREEGQGGDASTVGGSTSGVGGERPPAHVVGAVSGFTRGVASGVAPDGALLIASDGNLYRITTGTVRIAASHSNPFPEPR
jgi:BirA family transcriptional regulator, biotin operon repressor / biotin---[acetyl-CoA-carboxylase] ligase